MPIDILLKHHSLLLFKNCFSRVSLQKDQFVPRRANNCREESSLLTTGSTCGIYNCRGETSESASSAGDCSVGLLCIAAAVEAWWLAWAGADGGPSTHKPSGRLTSTKLSDHTATLFSAFLNWLCFKNTVETITNIVTSKPVMTFTLHKRRKLSSVAD